MRFLVTRRRHWCVQLALMHRLYVRSSYLSNVCLYHLQLALVTQAVMLDLNSVASFILMMVSFFSLLRLFALCAHCLCCMWRHSKYLLVWSTFIDWCRMCASMHAIGVQWIVMHMHACDPVSWVEILQDYRIKSPFMPNLKIVQGHLQSLEIRVK